MMENSKSEKIYKEILQQLDRSIEDYTFPIFNNPNFPLAAMRIVCFKDEEEWLILFDRIVFGISEGIFLNMISAFGSNIDKPGLQSSKEFIEEVPGMPIWDNELNYVLNEADFEIIINEKKRKFSFTENDYERSGVIKFPKMNKGLRLLRLLTYKCGDDIYMSPSTLLKRIDHRNMPGFLIVDEWNHPDVYEPVREMPGKNSCFQSLAKAMAYNDRDMYDCKQDKNSHWYDWDETGLY